MLHLVYILAFTVIAFFAISNLIRSLINLGAESRRGWEIGNQGNFTHRNGYTNSGSIIHPELLDETGKPVNEPLLVMRSVSVEDARAQLDALYDASPNPSKETED